MALKSSGLHRIAMKKWPLIGQWPSIGQFTLRLRRYERLSVENRRFCSSGSRL